MARGKTRLAATLPDATSADAALQAAKEEAMRQINEIANRFPVDSQVFRDTVRRIADQVFQPALVETLKQSFLAEITDLFARGRGPVSIDDVDLA